QVPRLSAPDGWHLGGRPAKRGPPEAEGSPDHPAQPGRPPGAGDRGAQRLPVRMGHLLPSRPLPDPAAPPRGLDPAQVALVPPQAVQASPGAGGLPAKSWGTGMASLASRPQRQGLLAQSPKLPSQRGHDHRLVPRPGPDPPWPTITLRYKLQETAVVRRTYARWCGRREP